MTECNHDYTFTTDGLWGICRHCGDSSIVVSDREEQLYKIFKARLMKELKMVGYRLVEIDEDSPYRVTQVYDDVTILPDGTKVKNHE